MKLAPSILSADFTQLGRQVAECEAAGADWIHIDVMDGHFVPNLTMGPVVVEAVRRVTALPLDVHLMITQPERSLADYARAGADVLTVHVEACPHLHRTIQQIKELGKRAGVALNPGTPVEAVSEVVAEVDLLLAMSVNPGFSGQTFIPSTPAKMRRLKALVEAAGAGDRVALEVDGGIDARTLPLMQAAGATVCVAATAVFKTGQPIGAALAALRAAAA